MSIRKDSVVYAFCAVFLLAGCNAVTKEPPVLTSTAPAPTVAAPALECDVEHRTHRVTLSHSDHATVGVEVEENGAVGELARISRTTGHRTSVELSPFFTAVTITVDGETATITNSCKD